jgi:ATP-binding cassette subfamily B protein
VEEEISGRVYDCRILRRLTAYLRPYRGAVAASLLLLLVHSLLQVIGPLLTKTAIDVYLVPGNSPPPSGLAALLPDGAGKGMLVISTVYLAAILLALAVEFFQNFLMVRTGQRAMLDLRRDIYSRVHQLDLSYFDRTPVGRVVTRVTGDVDQLNELLSSGLVAILGHIAMLLLIITAMLQLSPGMTMMLLAVMPAVIWVTSIFRRSVQRSYRKTRVAVAKINAFLQEHVAGIAVLQLFNREAVAHSRFEEINREHMDAFKESIFAYGWFYPVVEFLSMLALALLLSYGGWQAERGAISLGVVVAFFQYGLRFFRPIQELSEKYNILQSAVTAAERIIKLLDTKPSIVASGVSGPLDPASGIEFDNVWFSYHSQPDDGSEPEWVIRGLSFRIRPGETVAIVGHTGAGKTTIISLLLRFYDIQRGAIRIGGVDIRQMDPRQLRQAFGVVLQDPYLFTGTLEENIRMGTASIPAARIQEAVERVNLGEFVGSLDLGLKHPIRERGAGLSTGQKQLVGFARALAHDPQYLILDEATSSVDTDTEVRIRQALDQLVTGRTSILIAHRLSTIQRADRIYVMHRGELREDGTHQQLLSLRGIYYRLYQLQYKEQEIDSSPRLPLASLEPAALAGD